MADLKERIWIDRPIDEVFQFLQNPKNRIDMYTNVVDVIRENEDDQAGGRYKEVRQLSNRRVATMLELVELEKNERVTFASDSNGYKVIYRYKLREYDGGTNIDFEGTIKTETLRTKLIKSVLVKMQVKEDKDHLLQAKKRLENNI